jgi:hypothetical protein
MIRMGKTLLGLSSKASTLGTEIDKTGKTGFTDEHNSAPSPPGAEGTQVRQPVDRNA